MNKWLMAAGAATLAWSAAAATTAETEVKAPITRVAIFKNGTAAVTREIANPPETPFYMDCHLAPIRGTLWFTPGRKLEAARVVRELETPNYRPFSNLSETYAGQRVTLEIRTGSGLPRRLSGVVIKPARPAEPAGQLGEASYAPFLLLEQEDALGKLIAVRQELIESIQSDAVRSSIRMERPVLLITPHEKIGRSLTVAYVTAGLNWKPAYRLTLMENQRMRLAMSAEISNRLADLNGVEAVLVAGHPHVYCQQELSALAIQPAVPLRAESAANFARKSLVSPMVDTLNEAGGVVDSGTTSDLHKIEAGKLSIKKDDALYRELGSAEGSFERLVNWVIPDRFDADGHLNRNNREPNGTLWDAVRFKNPLKSPIVPAPVEVVDGSDVLAVSEGEWVNVGDQTTLNITKAQTVSGKVTEYEANPLRPAAMPDAETEEVTAFAPLGTPAAAKRAGLSRVEQVWINGTRYRNPDVVGVLTLKNFRDTPAAVVIRLNYSGNLVAADRSPVDRSIGRGITSINRQGQLEWELTLAPGEELKLNYRYSVLIRD